MRVWASRQSSKVGAPLRLFMDDSSTVLQGSSQVQQSLDMSFVFDSLSGQELSKEKSVVIVADEEKASRLHAVYLYGAPVQVALSDKLVGGEVHASSEAHKKVTKSRFSKGIRLLNRIRVIKSPLRKRARWVATQVTNSVSVMPELQDPDSETLTTYRAAVKAAVLGASKLAWRSAALSYVVLVDSLSVDYEASKDWQLLKHTYEQIHTSTDIIPYMLDILNQAKSGSATFSLAKAFQTLQQRVLWEFDGVFSSKQIWVGGLTF